MVEASILACRLLDLTDLGKAKRVSQNWDVAFKEETNSAKSTEGNQYPFWAKDLLEVPIHPVIIVNNQ